MQSANESFLSLVKLGIGHNASIPEGVDWDALEALATRHGLSAIVLDGIERLPDNCRPSQLILLQWIGVVLSSYENNYVEYEKAIGQLAHFYNTHGFKMMVLKGYGLSLNYPKPSHRPCGDIDIWLFGEQKAADSALAASSRFQDSCSRIDNSHHHHSVFEWQGFTIENHYDFINVYAHKSSHELEKIFKELGQDDSIFVEVNGERVYLPSPNLHALFLLRHMISHFAAAEISLRQVLDWAFFIEKHTKEIDWKWLVGLLEKYHMKDFFGIINAICVEDLGFSLEIFQIVQFNPFLKEEVLNDILEPKYPTTTLKELLPRLIYKYYRWWGNAWKQKLCYNESRWSAFWYGIYAKLLKPSSF